MCAARIGWGVSEKIINIGETCLGTSGFLPVTYPLLQNTGLRMYHVFQYLKIIEGHRWFWKLVPDTEEGAMHHKGQADTHV